VLCVAETGRLCQCVITDVTDRCDDVIGRGVDSSASAPASDVNSGLGSALLASRTVPVASLVGVDRLRLRQQPGRQPDLPRRRHLLPAASSAAAAGRPDLGRPADRPTAFGLPITGLVRPTLSESTKSCVLAPSARFRASAHHRRVQERPLLCLRRLTSMKRQTDMFPGTFYGI